jgi:glyoxylate reductase
VTSKIVVTTHLPGDPVGLLRTHPEGRDAEIVHLDEHRKPTRAELLDAVRGATALLPHIPDRIDAEVMDAAGPDLGIIANYGVGYDNIDLEAARERGVIVTNTPDVLTDATADIAWLLIMNAARGTLRANRDLREGAWSGWHPAQYVGKDLVEKTLLIVGMGRIGLAVARRAVGWRMRILYTARTPKPEAEAAPVGAVRVDLEDGLVEADVVSLHCPLTAETRHLLDERRLGMLKRGAILVNTARGAVIDEAALARTLERGDIHAAGLDVFEHEPEVHPGIRDQERATILPHIGSGSEDTRVAMTRIAVENLLAGLSGDPPPNRVD